MCLYWAMYPYMANNLYQYLQFRFFFLFLKILITVNYFQASVGLGREVCGSDRVTYSSECELRHQACVQQRDIVLVSLGMCPGQFIIFLSHTNKRSKRSVRPIRSHFKIQIYRYKRKKNARVVFKSSKYITDYHIINEIVY